MARKVIVAVHGMGEQLRGETIRSVAYQVCRFWDVPASMPLGRFGAELIPGGLPSGTVDVDLILSGRGTWKANPPDPPTGSFLMVVPPDPPLPAEAGAVVFGEVYWADIPRGPAAHRYTLEEAKKWAQSVVERVRERDTEARNAFSRGNSTRPEPRTLYPERLRYEFARTVISQLAEGIGVLGRLFSLSEKAGLPAFELDDLLVNYLGDVQVFTEFQNFRRQILDTFHALMQGIHDRFPDAEIFVVAHSEGSVIAFLAMLEALRGVKSGVGPKAGEAFTAPWRTQLRGLMTIGSPIGKHQLLWPWLWTHLGGGPANPPQIQWRNYYDYGDPVGFDLENARKWLQDNGWQGVFDFGPADGGDVGFTRYPFPGKAHTDYWNDAKVFDHFLGSVVWPGAAPGNPAPAERPRRAANAPPPPPTNWFSWIVSRCFPYLLVLFSLFLGAYLLIKGSAEAHGIELSAEDFARDLLGAGFLLAGVTAAVRVPRLTGDLLWVVGVLLLFGASLYAFPKVVSDGQKMRLWMSLSLPPNEEKTLFVHATTAAAVCLAFLLACLAAQFGIRDPSDGPCPDWWSPWLKPGVFAVLATALSLVFVALVPQSWTAAWKDYDLDMYPPTAVILGLTVLVALLTFVLSVFFPWWGVKTVVSLGMAALLIETALTWMPSGMFQNYHTIKEEAAKGMGLQGPLLDQASLAILVQLAKENKLSGEEADLRTAAHRQAMTLRGDARFSKNVQPLIPLMEVVVQHGEVSRGRIWPFILASAAFFYLWWLAALLLDLSVVWHHFIKGEAVMKMLPPPRRAGV